MTKIEKIQQLIREYGQAQFNLGVASVKLGEELALALPQEVEAEPKPEDNAEP